MQLNENQKLAVEYKVSEYIKNTTTKDDTIHFNSSPVSLMRSVTKQMTDV